MINRNRPRLLFVVNVDWFFLSHRLALAQAAKSAGYEVIVIAKDSGEGQRIRDKGFEFIPVPVSRYGINPLTELISFNSLKQLYQKLQPDLVHHFTIKPVIYGSLAARFAGFPAIVNSITGLGYTFSQSRRARFFRPFVKQIYGQALKYPFQITILQHEEDRQTLIKNNLLTYDQTVVIESSGVDCEKFSPTPEPETNQPIVILPARMSWDKGIKEFIEAARWFRAHKPHARFVLAGRLEEGNPGFVSEKQIKKWVREEVVEWWGNCENMPQVLSQSSIVVLPSYWEGVPKALLEAAASARAIVATNIPGCQKIVKHNKNGLLVPVKDASSLINAIKQLLDSRALREKLGQAGRNYVEENFAQELVIQKTLHVYETALQRKGLREEELILT